MQRRYDEETENLITQSKGSARSGRRREEYEDEQAEPLIFIPLPPPPPTKKCRCPYCNYEIVVEWGARCLNSVCPRCGHSMIEA